MKSKYLAHVLGLVFGLCFFGVQAQSPTTHQGWTTLEESSNHIDVSYSVMQCDANSSSEILLHVFNENPAAQSVSFTLTVTNPSSSATTSLTVSNLQLSAAEMISAECGSTSYSNLRFSVPSGYDPSTLTVDITYN